MPLKDQQKIQDDPLRRLALKPWIRSAPRTIVLVNGLVLQGGNEPRNILIDVIISGGKIVSLSSCSFVFISRTKV